MTSMQLLVVAVSVVIVQSLPVAVINDGVQFVTPYSSERVGAAGSEPFSTVNATEYLRLYGYLPFMTHEGQSSDIIVVEPQDYQNALKSFQRFASIPETGILDDATVTRMKMPRCGMKDLGEESDLMFGVQASASSGNEVSQISRKKRYSIEGSYWGVKDITYQISRYTHELSPDKVDTIMDRAFKVWEEYSPLRFVKRDRGPVNIDVTFASRSHGDGEPFDGRGGILAHAFFPRYGGDVHFDDDEPWRAPDTKGIDLYSVASHEIGHSLGLKHTQNMQALMAPFYQAYTGDTIHLHPDDVQALQHLYGTPQDRVNTDRPPNGFGNGNIPLTPVSTPVQKTPPIAPNVDLGRNFNICDDPKLDAVTIIGNGSTYAFKGNLYWRLNQISFDEGFPRNITEDWDGLPGDLDASVTDYDGDTYFFKGDQYWLYDPSGRRYKGYPRKISVGLVDTPDNVDAAMIWSYDDKPYFFKGDKFWQYSRWGMPSGWPRSTRDISPDFPQKVDAAFKWNNGKTYVFAGHQYYRLTGWRVMRIVENYPRDTGEWWFGCPRKDNLRSRRQSIDYTQK